MVVFPVVNQPQCILNVGSQQRRKFHPKTNKQSENCLSTVMSANKAGNDITTWCNRIFLQQLLVEVRGASFNFLGRLMKIQVNGGSVGPPEAQIPSQKLPGEKAK